MTDEFEMQAGPIAGDEDRLNQISQTDFVTAWKALVGEPPALLLESRSEMIRILVDSIPMARSDLTWGTDPNGGSGCGGP